MNDKQNKTDNEKILDSIINLEEYYCLEDYGNYQMLESTFTQHNKSNTNKSRLIFEVDKKSKELIIEKKNIEKIYAHIRIYDSNKENYINIYINRQESKYDENNILSRINKRQFFKGIIFIKYKIKEFPLKNYYLEEEVNNDGLAEKVYILKKIDNTKIINNQNEIQIKKKRNSL